MKKNRRKGALFVIVTMVIMLFSQQYVYAKDNYESIMSLTQEHIQETRNLISDVTWTENTKIEDITPTYSIDNEINGYIVLLETNSIDSGYIQFRYISGNLEVVSYTFSGKHKTSNIDEKIFYLGSLNFAYQIDEDTYGLVGYENEQFSINDLEQMTSEPSDRVEETTYSARSVTLIPNFSSSYMVTMTDFSGYSDHCSPTSGTNWVKYWGYCRGMSNLVKSNGTTMSDSQIFTRLYTLMKTNVNKVGTNRADKVSGLSSYCSEHSLPLSKAYYTSTALSFSGYKTSINNGNPVLLSLSDEAGSSYGDHGVMGVGYVGTTAIIMDGWSAATVYVVYSELGVAGNCEVGF